jgi:hypothetical protein
MRGHPRGCLPQSFPKLTPKSFRLCVAMGSLSFPQPGWSQAYPGEPWESSQGKDAVIHAGQCYIVH